MKNEVINKIFRIVGIVISSLIIAVLIFILIYRIGAMSYYKNSSKAFTIPGLSTGLIPQGLDYDNQNDVFLMCGYMNKKDASRVYVISEEDGVKNTVKLLDEEGNIFTGHSGGITHYQEYVYLAGSSSHCIYVYSYDDILTKSEAKCLGKISLEASDSDYIRVSFIGIVNGELVVGEYYRSEKSYSTLDSHHLTSVTGEKFGGFMVSFDFDDEAPFKVNPTPKMAFSLPNLTQGVAYHHGVIYVSTSTGNHFSHIYSFDISKLNSSSNVDILGTNIPAYTLDSDSLIKKVVTPPMSEEIIVKDGYLYILTESASNKYFTGKLIGGNKVYQTTLDFFK